MNSEDRKALGRVILATAVYYGRQVSQDVLSMMIDDLSDLPINTVLSAYSAFRRDARNKFFPLPAQIREMITPQVDPESAARELAARITGAIPKFGYANSQEAREYIGELGWQIIQRQGGWTYICEHHGLRIDPTAFQAQIREQAKASLKYGDTAINDMINGRSSVSEQLPPALTKLIQSTKGPA